MHAQNIELHGRIWLTFNGKPLLGKGRVELLARIGESGSISRAAKAMRMSYKAAWDAVDAMNNALGAPVVESATGGARGGGSRLTALGRNLIAEYRLLEQQHHEWMSAATPDLLQRLAAPTRTD